MDILIVSRGIPTKENPLSGIFEWDQAKALKQKGHNVTLFVLDLRSIRRKRSLGCFENTINGIRVFVWSFPVGAVPPRILVRFGRIGIRKLYKRAFQNGEKPTVIHAHFTEYGGMAAHLAHRKEIPLVITEHSSVMVGTDVPKKLLTVAEKAYRSADQVIAVSSMLSDNIKKLTGVECVVVHNIIDGDVFRSATGTKHTGFRFVSVSNLIPRKRIDLLLEAFSIVSRKCQDAVLEVIGDGSERNKLEEMTESLNLRQRVVFSGRLSRNEIAERFREADCFVLPSKQETFGVVYAEAMMAGLPVIATVCGGPEEFVTDEVGKVGYYDSPKALADVMEEMYHSASEYDPAMIREYADSHFSPEIIAEKLTDIYRSVLDRRAENNR